MGESRRRRERSTARPRARAVAQWELHPEALRGGAARRGGRLDAEDRGQRSSAAVDDFETARALEPDAADRVRAKLLVADVSTLRRLARDVARRKGDERVARALSLFAAPAPAAAGKG